jgi:hypothetical protein
MHLVLTQASVNEVRLFKQHGFSQFAISIDRCNFLLLPTITRVPVAFAVYQRQPSSPLVDLPSPIPHRCPFRVHDLLRDRVEERSDAI